jgi:hypothetical protein
MNEAVCLKVRTPAGVSELNVLELLEVDGRSFIPAGDMVERLAYLEGRLQSLETQFSAALASGG